MSQKLSVTLIDTGGNISVDKIESPLNGNEIKPECLCPDDLHISFFNDKIVLLSKETQSLVRADEKLSEVEQNLGALFPNSKIFHLTENEEDQYVGYVLIEDGRILRAKAVRGESIEVDEQDITVYEQGILNTMRGAILEAFANDAEKIQEAIEGKSDKEQLKFFLEFRSQIVKDNILYDNGNFDREFIQKVIPRFIDTDRTGFMDLSFMQYKGVKLTDSGLDIKKYLADAYARLPLMESEPIKEEEE